MPGRYLQIVLISEMKGQSKSLFPTPWIFIKETRYPDLMY